MHFECPYCMIWRDESVCKCSVLGTALGGMYSGCRHKHSKTLKITLGFTIFRIQVNLRVCSAALKMGSSNEYVNVLHRFEMWLSYL